MQEIMEFPELNVAVEWCEDQILKREGIDLSSASRPLLIEHQKLLKDIDESRFLSYFQRIECVNGDYLMRQGDKPVDIYFIERGQINVQIETSNGQTIRLRKMGPGAVVGEIEMYLGTNRGASVVVTENSVVYRLTTESLTKMQEDIPDFAAHIHQLMATLMAERLMNNNRTIETLLK